MSETEIRHWSITRQATIDPAELKKAVYYFYDQVFNKRNYVPVEKLFGGKYHYNGSPQTPKQLEEWVNSLYKTYDKFHLEVINVGVDVSGPESIVNIIWVVTVEVHGTQLQTYGVNFVTGIGNGGLVSNWQGGGAMPIYPPPPGGTGPVPHR